ncbi:hypothetical protein PsorP6_009932 [Peronosclerospora sorghi]|uniref:Uncharacterized protein n=1 Tax=Peronosclerospora sorghi TaxID=230839 RepID=A0ACC0VUG8_9STRA|nr:hypothetical protein PsorP6_009932 [Peronosclerospora sorghi]
MRVMNDAISFRSGHSGEVYFRDCKGRKGWNSDGVLVVSAFFLLTEPRLQLRCLKKLPRTSKVAVSQTYACDGAEDGQHTPWEWRKKWNQRLYCRLATTTRTYQSGELKANDLALSSSSL